MVEISTQFIRGLNEINPWWESGKPKEDISSFKRSDFNYYCDRLKETATFVLIGPRRVGKSTLINQLIEKLLLEEQVDPKRILYLSLEKPFFELTSNRILESIEYYENQVLGHSIKKTNKKIYIFIDEAQYDSTWTTYMKHIVDEKYNVFGFVSGSSATELEMKNKESGAGRFKRSQIVTMKFRDVVRFRDTKLDEKISEISSLLRKGFFDSCSTGNIKRYYESALKAVQILNSDLPKVKNLFEEYLLKGGYPEFYQTKDSWENISSDYQTNTFDSIITKDVVNTYDVKHSDKIRKLLVMILQSTGSVISRKTLARPVNLMNAMKTLDSYLDALAEAFLIRTASRYKKGQIPSTKEKKFFAADVGLRNSILGIKEKNFEGKERGFLVESVIFNHALRLCFHIDRRIRLEGFYWDSRDKGEHDIILDLKQKIGFDIPLEAKSGQVSKYEKNKVKFIARKINSPFGLITSKDRIELDDNVLVIPNWLFLLTC